MATNETDSIFLIDSKEAAFVLGISSRTLANWRCKGRGPAYIRLGKKRSPCDVSRERRAGLDCRTSGKGERRCSPIGDAKEGR